MFMFCFTYQRHRCGHYRDVQVLQLEEDSIRTNIGIFACMSKTTDAPHVSWKTFNNEVFGPDQDSDSHGGGLSFHKRMTKASRQQPPQISKVVSIDQLL